MYYFDTMNWTKYIFVALLSITMTVNDANAARACDSAAYRLAHPGKCNTKKTGTALTLAGGAAAIAGGALVAMQMGGGGGDTGAPTSSNSAGVGLTDSGAPRATYPAPQLGTARTDTLNDVDARTLAEIMSRPEYIANKHLYDEIGVAFSLGRGYTGAGYTIAILDTGDEYWHGQVVRDIAGAVIAPDAKIETYQIAYNSSEFFTWSEIGAKITAARNADVINNSWNVAMAASDITSREQIAALTDASFISAVSDAANNGSIFVWAAGNDGLSQSGALSALPRVMPELRGRFINVVAWDSEKGELADFSNACGVTRDWCITAPGTDIASGWRSVDGTSFAAPQVSAAITVLKQAFPYLSPEQITELLFVTATDLGAPGVDDIYGHGMMDLERASRPVGTAQIASAGGNLQPLRTAHVNGAIARRIQSADIQFAFFDSFGRPFQTNLSDNVSVRNRGIGFVRLRGDATRKSIQFGNMEFGFNTDDLMLGDGFLQTDGRTATTFVATNNQLYLGDIELFQTAQFGTAKPRPAVESAISEFSNLYTAAFNVGLRTDDWMFSIGIPETIISGDMQLHLATGRDANGALRWTDYTLPMDAAPAIEYAVGWRFMTIGFVDNPYGRDEIYMVTRTNLRF